MDSTTIKSGDYFTVPAAAKKLGHDKVTLYRWWKSKKISLVYIGGILFVPKKEIKRLLKKEQSENIKAAV